MDGSLSTPEHGMGRIDLFESVFKAATRDVYEHQKVAIDTVLVVTDTTPEEATRLQTHLASMFAHLSVSRWEVLTGMDAADIGNLLDTVNTLAPNLVCTYRNLHSNASKWPYTLGDHVEVLTQVSDVPVLLTPRPDHAMFETDATPRVVMAMTDHLAGDNRLVSHAAAFTPEGGSLILTHVEDEVTFIRYLDAVAKIPAIDTDTAEDAIKSRLLRDPAEFIETCRHVLETEANYITVQPAVTMGQLVPTTKQLIIDHHIDLLVINTKDDGQMAMHGLAYPLAVELRDIPMLML